MIQCAMKLAVKLYQMDFLVGNAGFVAVGFAFLPARHKIVVLAVPKLVIQVAFGVLA